MYTFIRASVLECIRITWASFVGPLCAVCLSSLCIAHEKTCLESLSISFPPTVSVSLLQLPFDEVGCWSLHPHTRPPRFCSRLCTSVALLLYKLLMTAKPNRQNERASIPSFARSRKLSKKINVESRFSILDGGQWVLADSDVMALVFVDYHELFFFL